MHDGVNTTLFSLLLIDALPTLCHVSCAKTLLEFTHSCCA